MSLTSAPPAAPRRAAAPPRLAGVSVVLPCRDEAPNLRRTLSDWRLACAGAADTWELIVVDDGSTDATARIALEADAVFGDVRLVRHERNLGYGAALRSGIRAATLPWTFITDGDGQFDARDLERTLAPACDHDVVAGYRARRAEGILRRFNGAAWTRLTRALLGLPVRDVDCAFKLVRTGLVRDLPLLSDGATVSAELLARLVRADARIAEIPVAHRPRTAGRASGANPRVIARAFRELRVVRRALRSAA
jgi:glycosyltransferase involved in cell wall biosynthesis